MKKRWLINLFLALGVSFFHLYLFLSPLGQRLEPRVLDYWFNLRGAVPAPDDVVVLAMDEASFRELGVPLNSIWPRALHARLLERLAEYEVKRVIFDILFLDQGADPAADEALAAAIANVPVVLGVELGKQEDQYGDREADDRAFVWDYFEYLYPYEPFLENADGVALVGLTEPGGVVRNFSFNIDPEIGVDELPTLAQAALVLDNLKAELPTDRDFINFYGPPGQGIARYSYYEVLDQKRPLPKAKLKDKTIYVGLVLRTAVASEEKDSFGTPFYGENMFGTEIHATAASNLINQDWISRASPSDEIWGLSLIALILSFLLFALSPGWGAVLLLFYVLLWAVTSFIFFLSAFFVPGLLLAIAVLPTSYLCSTLYSYLLSRRSQQKIQRAFELYLSPEMAKRMARGGRSLTLGGESVNATALFTDIEGFTAITEKMSAEDVSAMLNAYFTEVMDVIFENNGTLIKFIGDAVFVIWGAPLKIDNHAALAVKTAMAIQQEVERFIDSERFPPLRTRIGVHSGKMVVGNLGSVKRFDYTAIGDAVNLAARVEGINKYFGTYLMITAETLKQLADQDKELVKQALYMGAVQVVGKEDVTGLYAFIDMKHKAEIYDNWSRAVEAYQAQEWDKAEDLFFDITLDAPLLSKAARLYLSQIAAHRNEPPDSDWQGQIVFEKK
jgi:adenylate cyclase